MLEAGIKEIWLDQQRAHLIPGARTFSGFPPTKAVALLAAN
jgi:hypothetical protein